MQDQVPNVNFVYRVDGKNITKTTDDIFLNKKIVVFALPGAFTPTCSDYHLPSYEDNYEELKKYRIDEVFCLSMNDPFVINIWKKNFSIQKVNFIPDGNGDFTKGMNMLTDRSESGMGMRSFRYSMYVDNKKIIKLFKDENGKFDVSDAGTMINFLKSLNAQK
jgi:peroxiredoxin|tara:strand:- start:2832 stop:3320 length:489 start_codon:yes stop_codon:yes gene_type:complete